MDIDYTDWKQRRTEGKKLTNKLLSIFEELIECDVIDNEVLECVVELSELLPYQSEGKPCQDEDYQNKILKLIEKVKEG
jgi:hypothetical protein